MVTFAKRSFEIDCEVRSDMTDLVPLDEVVKAVGECRNADVVSWPFPFVSEVHFVGATRNVGDAMAMFFSVWAITYFSGFFRLDPLPVF